MAKSLHLRYLSEPFQEPSQPEAGSPTSLGFKNTHLSRTTRGRARRSQKKESGEGGLKLEAEKDNGLDNCAPSVRYIVRRLIRDGCSRGTAMPKSYIVPLFAVQAPVDVVSWIKWSLKLNNCLRPDFKRVSSWTWLKIENGTLMDMVMCRRRSLDNIMSKLRNLDVYPKINEDFFNHSLYGGVITLASSILMFLLFYSELRMTPLPTS
ncbi:hypothetical protein JHK85_019872 [Glycine max]|nr:hypothetical protein JHK85_019872 [Glycine max]